MKIKVLRLTQFSILLAIEAIVCFTPLGSLPAIGPIVATLGMLPVIVTAILLGTGAGAAMGAFAGLFSFIVWTFMPPSPVVAFAFTPFYSLGEVQGNFWSLVVCFVPRILVGVVTGFLYNTLQNKLSKFKGKDVVVYGVSGFLGSMTNTFLVLGGIALFFGRQYTEAIAVAYEALFGIIGLTILTSGIPEAVLGGLVAYAACRPIKRHILKKI